MINEPYWGLFWATGMPEAWMMSRGGPIPTGSIPLGMGQEMSGPLASAQPRMSEESPEGPQKPY